MLAMTFIHTSAYYLSNKTAFTLWNYSQFAVPVFIFCSSYIFFTRPFDWKQTGSYIVKRLKRLLLPYYLFLIFYIVIILPGEPSKQSVNFILGSLTLTSGIDLNWLVVLFLQFIAVNFLLQYSKAKSSLIFTMFSLLALISSLVFLTTRFPYSYKIIMWLPWSIIIVFTMLFVEYVKKRWFLSLVFLISLSIFLILGSLLSSINRSLVMFDNKYPPNLYYLSYGVLSILVLFLLFKQKFMQIFPIRRFLTFLSIYSYEIFFIHFLVIFIITIFFKNLKFTWISFFLVVFTITMTIQWALNKTAYFFSMLKKAN